MSDKQKKSEIASINRKIKSYKADIKVNKADIKNYETKIKIAKDEIKSLDKKGAAAKNQLIKEYKNSIKALETQNKKYNTIVNNLTKKQTALNDALTAFKDLLAANKDALAEYKSALADAQDSIYSNFVGGSSISSFFDSFNSELEEKKSEYETAKADYDAAVEEFGKNSDYVKSLKAPTAPTEDFVSSATTKAKEYLSKMLKYGALLEYAVNTLKIPPSLLADIMGMSIDDAITVLTALKNQGYSKLWSTNGLFKTFSAIDFAAANIATKSNLAAYTVLGDQIIAGLVSGLKSSVKSTATKSAVTQVSNTLLTYFKKEFKIASPSKVMATLGGYLTQGLADGMSVDDVTNKLSAIKEAVVSDVESMNSDIQSVVDLTNLSPDDISLKTDAVIYNQNGGVIDCLNSNFKTLFNKIDSMKPNNTYNFTGITSVDELLQIINRRLAR